MKKRILHLAALILCAVLLLPYCITASADGEIKVNGKSAASGDTVTFELRMGGIKDPLEAAGAYINYDPECLMYIDGSIGFDVFKNAMYNIGDGLIYYSAIDVISGFDLSEEQMIVRLSFTVLDGAKGETEITNSFDEIFTLTDEEHDLTEKDYSVTAITTVAEEYKGNDAPNPGIDGNKIEEYQQSSETDFDNLMLGTDREELIASAAVSTESSAAPSSEESGKQSDVTASEGTGSSSSPTNSTITSEPQSNNSRTTVIVIAVIFVILVLAAIILKIFVGKRKTK